MSDYPIVDLSTDALLTTTRSVRKRLDLTKPVPIGLIRNASRSRCRHRRRPTCRTGASSW